MPTYVYECSSCHQVSEVEQRITEDALDVCPACHKKGTIKRVIQPVAVSFKGAGFHINDYAAKAAPIESTPSSTPATPAAAPAPAAPEAPAAPTTPPKPD